MPSPFPRINPYFEQAGIGPNFHTEFLSTLRRQLTPQTSPEYIVPLEEPRIHDLPPEPRQRIRRADLSVSWPESISGPPEIARGRGGCRSAEGAAQDV